MVRKEKKGWRGGQKKKTLTPPGKKKSARNESKDGRMGTFSTWKFIGGSAMKWIEASGQEGSGYEGLLSLSVAWMWVRLFRVRWGWMPLWLWPSATASNVSLGRRGFVMDWGGVFFFLQLKRPLAQLCPVCPPERRAGRCFHRKRPLSPSWPPRKSAVGLFCICIVFIQKQWASTWARADKREKLFLFFSH